MSQQKRIVLTGATRGLGRALVKFFSAQKYIVAGCGSSRAGVASLREEFGTHHRFDVVDIADDQAVAAWSSGIEAPDLLINNAGLIARSAPLWELTAGEADRVVDVNLKGVMNVIRHFLPGMIARGRGVVVNFSSGWGRSTSPEVAVYCATKWDIEGLTQSLSQELPRGLAAVALNPGIIHTEMLESCFGGSARDYPSPDEWAKNAGPFLLKLDASQNGRALTVPGIPT